MVEVFFRQWYDGVDHEFKVCKKKNKDLNWKRLRGQYI